MKVTLQGLWGIKEILSREVLGVDIKTGERKKPDLRLPVSMKRHLRRVLEAVDDEIRVSEPERIEFINKWKGDGDKMPDFGTNPDFDKEYNELFFEKDLVIPFSPFHTELLDEWNELVPDDVTGIMDEMNAECKRQNAPATGDSDKGPESPKADA